MRRCPNYDSELCEPVIETVFAGLAVVGIGAVILFHIVVAIAVLFGPLEDWIKDRIAKRR